MADVEITSKTDSSGAQNKNKEANNSGKKKKKLLSKLNKNKEKNKNKNQNQTIGFCKIHISNIKTYLKTIYESVNLEFY